MLWILLWIAFGIVTALAAGSRARNPLAWFALGVLFGPFALVAVLVMDRGNPAR